MTQSSIGVGGRKPCPPYGRIPSETISTVWTRKDSVSTMRGCKQQEDDSLNLTNRLMKGSWKNNGTDNQPRHRMVSLSAISSNYDLHRIFMCTATVHAFTLCHIALGTSTTPEAFQNDLRRAKIAAQQSVSNSESTCTKQGESLSSKLLCCS